jgi:hypothetical protein
LEPEFDFAPAAGFGAANFCVLAQFVAFYSGQSNICFLYPLTNFKLQSLPFTFKYSLPQFLSPNSINFVEDKRISEGAASCNLLYTYEGKHIKELKLEILLI